MTEDEYVVLRTRRDQARTRTAEHVHGVAEYVHGVAEYVHGMSEYVHGVAEYGQRGRACDGVAEHTPLVAVHLHIVAEHVLNKHFVLAEWCFDHVMIDHSGSVCEIGSHVKAGLVTFQFEYTVR